VDASADHELESLIERIRCGDEQAVERLLERYGPHVRRVVRQKLPRELRRRFDSIDFVQSVWRQFFDKLRAGRIKFQESRQLARFLVQMAAGKVADQCRRLLGAAKRDLTREVPLNEGESTAGDEPLVAPTPTPSQAVEANERLNRLLAGRPRSHQQVILLRLEGFTFGEIAAKTGLSERSARRIFKQFQQQARQ